MSGSEPSPRRTIHAVRPEEVTRVAVGAPGQILGGKYRLEKRVAAGGMASIWSATHVTLNRPVAVKFVDARTTAGHEERVGRFLREAKVAASIRHKNVVDILDFGVFDEGDVSEPYMIMELLEGESLDAMLSRAPLSTVDAINVVRQVLSGLDAVHAAGIVHRDMKPGNVFVTVDEDGFFARVLDFGISQGAEDVKDGSVVGTPEYMSPEQCYGDSLDRRSDIYSVGVMLYELLGGVLPFDDPDPTRVLRLVVDGFVPPLTKLRGDIPDLCHVVETAMARKPEERFQTAREMQRAIAEATGTPDATGRFTVPPRSMRGSGQYRREAKTLDGPDSIPPDAAGEPVRPLGIVTSETSTQPVPAATRTRGMVLVAAAVVVAVIVLVVAWSMRSQPVAHTPTPAPVAPVIAPPPSTVVAVRVEAPPSTVAAEIVPPTSVVEPAVEAPPATAAERAHRRSTQRQTGSITRELDF